jgi:transglutaminase-like putative cysteine protease
MKVKHIIISHFTIAILLLMLFGCANPELTRKITAWQRTYPNRKGDCMIYAMKAKAYYDRMGVRARICHGYWKGEKHAWVEYLSNGDTWLVDDKALGHKGWTRESYGDYELTWWGE